MPLDPHPTRDFQTEERFTLPEGKKYFTREDMEKLRTRETRKDSAIRAINNYFQSCRQLRTLEHLTIDALVQHCFNLVAVASYVDEEHELEVQHRRNIKNHISMKIKEYIDGKL
jgi:hypothetical protein